MSTRDPAKRITRNGKVRLVIDFFYIDKNGRKRRFRRDAAVQRIGAARAEAARFIELAARTGSPIAESEIPTFETFVCEVFRPTFMGRLRPATNERYSALFRQGVLAEFGRRRLDAIDFMAVNSYATKLTERGVQPRGPCNLVRSVVNAAVAAGVLEKMPRLPAFPPSPKLPDAPSTEYVTALLEAARGWVLVAIALAAFGGLRQGEIRALWVGDVRFDTGEFLIRRAFSANEVLGPKGRRGRERERSVPLIPELAEILRTAVQNKLPGAFVVTNRAGRVPRRQHVLAAIKRAQARAGLEPRSHHSLRHYFGSGLIRHGVSVETVRKLLGHANLGTTARYLHSVTDATTTAAISKLAGNSLATPK